MSHKKKVTKASAERARIKSGRKAPPPKKSKYGNKGVRLDGRYFHSQAEGNRYLQLKVMESAGRIQNLECQPRFACTVNNVKICDYLADFRYDVIDDVGNVLGNEVEDVKGMMTDIYKLKKKMVEAIYNITIHEIPSRQVESKWSDRLPTD